MYEVDNYTSYIQVQSESAMRTCAALYPYESADENATTLKSSQDEINDSLRQ